MAIAFVGIAQAAPKKTTKTAAAAQETGVVSEFDRIGGNSELMEKIRNIEPEKNIGIVQNRMVDRFRRIEIAPELMTALGGDSYLNTAGYGIVGQFHFNPSFSFGARYSKMSNALTTEGKNLISNNMVPDVDYPLSQTMAIASFYPVYGKINLFDRAVTHFDIYGTAGYGSIQLESGAKPTWVAGAGVGFWFSQHMSTRFELLYQSYEAERKLGKQDMNVTVGNVQIGYLL